MNLRNEELRRQITESGVFDSVWYANVYPDVIRNGLDPLDDFILFGLELGRDPGPTFSTREYMRRVPDAAKHPGGPFLHYLNVGRETYAGPILPDSGLHPQSHAYLSDNVYGLVREAGQIDLGLTIARIHDFRLHVRGWVLDGIRPGAVHRLQLRIGNTAWPPVIARQIVDGTWKHREPRHSGIFEASFPVPERLLGEPLEIAVLDTTARYRIIPERTVPAAQKHEPAGVVLPADIVLGKVESADSSTVSGWAICEREKSSSGIELVLKIDGEPFAVTRCTLAREDVQKIHGGDGFSGFQFHLPSNLWVGKSLSYEVCSTQGISNIQNSRGVVAEPAGFWRRAPNAPSGQIWTHKSDLEGAVKISVIILNRNGHDILEDMLSSAESTGDLDKAEWIVIDHQSNDGSVELCNDYSKKGFDVKVFSRNGNFSFSDSNNYGARLAEGNILVFANNDLIFTTPVIDRVAFGLRDSRIGILGAELHDHIKAPEWHETEDTSPVQHRGVHIKTRSEGGYLRPFETRSSPDQPVAANSYYERIAVTAAFIAIRRADFDAVGGFDETYSYGLEDIDLCLKAKRQLDLSQVLDTGLKIIHRHGFSRGKDTHAAPRRLRNNKHFNQTWGGWLRRQIRSSELSRLGLWTGRRPIIGFTVTNTETAGDFFTAQELGEAIQQQVDVHVVYLPREKWRNLSDIDFLINMSPNFDLHAVKIINPFIVTLNWVRQFFERWAESESGTSYDYVLASSQLSADYLAVRSGQPVSVMPLASNTVHFSEGTPREEFRCDYCFTGSYFGVSRDIQFHLDPAAVRGQGAVFGQGWEGTSLEKLSRGFQPYASVRDIYASSKIAIDDGVFATGPWGSLNSRVFDALASGCLPVTNNVLGAAELFGDRLPTFKDKTSLTEALNFWLENEVERQKRVTELSSIVEQQHDYAHRGAQVLQILSGTRPQRIAIKCPAKTANKELWGDYHFAQSLAKALREQGATVRVDLLEDWDSPLSNADEIVIALRGISRYIPKPHQFNIVWLISHPEAVAVSELADYDHVCVASRPYAEVLKQYVDVPVSVLLQCTDTQRFCFVPDVVGSRPERALFVGNSRGIFRSVVRWSIEKDLDIDIYGGSWEAFIKDSRLKGNSVPNEVLGELYASSRVVLCDHWPDMAKHGFLSNRAYDVLASGGFLVTDEVNGIADLLPREAYAVYSTPDELAELVQMERAIDVDIRATVADWIAENHSFHARARELAAIVASQHEGQRIL